MRSFHSILWSTILLFGLSACAVGPGKSPEDDFGTAALSLQLHGLEEGEIYLTQDGYRLGFDHCAFAFSQVELDEFAVEEPFAADFFDEEVTDLVEIDGILSGSYEAVALTLGQGEAEQAQRFLDVRGTKNSEIPSAALEGNSVFLQAQAVNGSNNCVVQVSLKMPGMKISVDPAGNEVEVSSGEESEILVEVDPNAIFAEIDLGGLCQGGGLLTISSEENAALANQISANLSNSFLLGGAEGHHH